MSTREHGWGTSRLLHLSEKSEVVEIRIQPGAASSLHVHDRKHNRFVVLQGTLVVTTETGVVKVLLPGEQHEVPAGTAHRMQNRSDQETLAIEIYQPVPGSRIEQADIRRFDEGWKPKLNAGSEPTG